MSGRGLLASERQQAVGLGIVGGLDPRRRVGRVGEAHLVQTATQIVAGVPATQVEVTADAHVGTGDGAGGALSVDVEGVGRAGVGPDHMAPDPVGDGTCGCLSGTGRAVGGGPHLQVARQPEDHYLASTTGAAAMDEEPVVIIG